MLPTLSRRILLTGLLFLSQLCHGGLPDMSALPANKHEPDFLTASEAFQAQVTPFADHWRVHFNIADGYYLYKSRIYLLGQENQQNLTFVQKPHNKHDKNFGDVEIYNQQLDIDIPLASAGQEPVLRYQGCSEQQLCYPPQKLPLQTATPPSPADNTPDTTSAFGQHSLWWIMLSFLGLGIGLSLTPCVFPMIPILSSIIAGQQNRSSGAQGFFLAAAYVTGMASAYAMIGILVSAFGAKVNLSAYTQTPLVISLAAALFVTLALSMFGLYELQLPAFIRNRLNDAGNKQQGGYLLGSLLMGFFAALVVSPCVSAPLAGALLYLSSTGDILTGGSALFALGTGMGAPLLLIGLTGGKFLPKAGSWMLNIKAAFGVGLLGVAVALLSRIIPPAATLLLCALLALGISIFMGIFNAAISPLRRYISLLFFLAGILWLTGAAMGNDNLLRPLNRQDLTAATPAGNPSALIKVENLAQLHTVMQAAATRQQKVIVDFYASWCTSCQEMTHFLHRADISALLQNYQLVRFDISAGSAEQLNLLTQLNIFGPPALQMFDLNGQAQGKALQGLPDSESLQTWLTSLP